MKKILQRLLIFFLGLPVLIVIVFFLPAYNHLCLNLLVIIFSILGALEFQNILRHKSLFVPPIEAAILGGLVPVLETAVISFGMDRFIVFAVFMAAASWLFVSRVFSARDKQDQFINRTAAGFYIMLYPGIFLAWIISMALFPEPGIVIIAFLLTVFLNDSAAWAAGMLFGKGNRGIIPASPNKSAAGFIGGILASVLTGVLCVLFFPQAFRGAIPALPSGAILGLATGIAAVLGDLGESVLKRSAGIKDSGVIIPGRGGILDSIDSIALAAPVFYIAYKLLFSLQ